MDASVGTAVGDGEGLGVGSAVGSAGEPQAPSNRTSKQSIPMMEVFMIYLSLP
jgi:hypothetical protein